MDDFIGFDIDIEVMLLSLFFNGMLIVDLDKDLVIGGGMFRVLMIFRILFLMVLDWLLEDFLVVGFIFFVVIGFFNWSLMVIFFLLCFNVVIVLEAIFWVLFVFKGLGFGVLELLVFVICFRILLDIVNTFNEFLELIWGLVFILLFEVRVDCRIRRLVVIVFGLVFEEDLEVFFWIIEGILMDIDFFVLFGFIIVVDVIIFFFVEIECLFWRELFFVIENDFCILFFDLLFWRYNRLYLNSGFFIIVVLFDIRFWIFFFIFFMFILELFCVFVFILFVGCEKDFIRGAWFSRVGIVLIDIW